jgi:hypothetical protein
MTGTIIFLNGTSSSGKTSILRALQDRLPDPYLDMGIDRFIFMLPRRYPNSPLWDDILGKAVRAGASGTEQCAQDIMERLKSPPMAFKELLLSI